MSQGSHSQHLRRLPSAPSERNQTCATQTLLEDRQTASKYNWQPLTVRTSSKLLASQAKLPIELSSWHQAVTQIASIRSVFHLIAQDYSNRCTGLRRVAEKHGFESGNLCRIFTFKHVIYSYLEFVDLLHQGCFVSPRASPSLALQIHFATLFHSTKRN